MAYCPNKHHRRSIRLSGYDYSKNGAYFISICTYNRLCMFGKIENGGMWLNEAGKVARQCWENIPIHFPHVVLDTYVIMPNHIHGILLITNNLNIKNVGPKNLPPLPHYNQRMCGTSKTIGSVVRGFKIGVTKWMRQNNVAYQVWQRNYYEHVIRNESKLNQIRQYIVDNPTQWEFDKENPIRQNRLQ